MNHDLFVKTSIRTFHAKICAYACLVNETHCYFKCFWKKSLLLIKPGFSLFDQKYRIKTIILWNIITTQNNGFLFYYTLKYRPVSVMQNWIFFSITPPVFSVMHIQITPVWPYQILQYYSPVCILEAALGSEVWGDTCHDASVMPNTDWRCWHHDTLISNISNYIAISLCWSIKRLVW